MLLGATRLAAECNWAPRLSLVLLGIFTNINRALDRFHEFRHNHNPCIVKCWPFVNGNLNKVIHILLNVILDFIYLWESTQAFNKGDKGEAVPKLWHLTDLRLAQYQDRSRTMNHVMLQKD